MKMINDILDILLDSLGNKSSFYGEKNDYDEVYMPYRCTLTVNVTDQDIKDGRIEIYFNSDKGLLRHKGIEVKLFSADTVILSLDGSGQALTNPQFNLINEKLNKCKEYNYFIEDIKRWNRNKGLEFINELIKSGDIEWSDPEIEIQQPWEIGTDHQVEFLIYTAEYGDITFTYFTLEDEFVIAQMYMKYDEDAPIEYLDYCEYAPHLEIKVGNYFKTTFYDMIAEEINLIFPTLDEDEEENVLDIDDVLVRTSNARCIERNHILEPVDAYVYVINKNSYTRELVSIKIYYCDTCNRYYILEREYNKLINSGILCCRVVDASTYNPDTYANLNEKSDLALYGYNVSKAVGLTEKERHMILDMVISSGVKSKESCIDFIRWLIRKRSNRANMEDAIAKWNSDIRYLQSGKRTLPSDIMVGAFLKKNK